MSDASRGPIEPVAPVGSSPRALPVRHPAERPTSAVKPAQAEDVPAATADAYAQFVVNPDTHDVVIRIRNSSTDEIIHEYPSSEVERMNHYLIQYSAALARRRAAKQN
jgi:FlaG protein